MTHYTIKITSDTVCPWCFVGFRRLSRAIEQHKERNPNDTFSTTWYPFYLNPDAPAEGVDKRAYYLSKFGEDRVPVMFERLSAIGESEGIKFKFGGRTGNTRNSHRLIQYSKEAGGEPLQTRVVEQLFKTYFENEGDITDRDALRNAAVKAGMESKVAEEVLHSDIAGTTVDREVQEAQRQLISGVPHFVIQDRYEVSGAQDPAAFLQLFDRIKSKA